MAYSITLCPDLQVPRLYNILPSMTDLTLDNAISTQDTLMADREMEGMLKAGVHLGHVKSKNHPSMKSQIYGIRNGVSVLDLQQTRDRLHKALDFIQNTIAKGGIITLVGTRPSARQSILEVVEKTQMPYFVDRWIGGTLTNFKIIAKRVEYMENMEKEKASGGFDKYTKKERLKKSEQILKLNKLFDGLRTMKKMPDAICVVDVTQDKIAVDEAVKMKIPVVALVDSNSNAKLIAQPITSNDDAVSAVQYMIGRIGEAIEEGQRELRLNVQIAAKEAAKSAE
mgnify:CR=1 FL=1